MRMRTTIVLAALVIVVSSEAVRAESPLGTDFTYQGQLKGSGVPVVSNADCQFALFDAVTGGAQIGSTLSRDNVGGVSGLFTISRDFGAAALDGIGAWPPVAVVS